MTALEYLRLYPNARPSTVALRLERDRKTEQLMAEVDAQVNAALVSHLAEILPEFERADRERIEETY